MAPLDPSEYMINVGSTASGIDKETIKTIYEAMLGAHFLNPLDADVE